MQPDYRVLGSPLLVKQSIGRSQEILDVLATDLYSGSIRRRFRFCF